MKLSCVMVVDDSPADQFFSEHIIKNFDSDITVLQAYDGAQALKLLEEVAVKPDVILLDINMPGMDGFGFLDKYDQEVGELAPVVMLTTSYEQKDRDRANAYRAVKRYVEKPVDESVLVEVSTLIDC